MTYATALDELRTDPIWEKLAAQQGVRFDGTEVFTSSVLGEISTCSWKAKLKYWDGVPEEKENIQALRGTVIHRAANQLHRERAWDDYADLYRQLWQETIGAAELPPELFEPNPRSASDHDKMRDDGEMMIAGYVERNRDAIVEVTEAPFRMLVPDLRSPGLAYRFSGTVDQLRREAFGNPHPQVQVHRPLEVFDLKSGAQPPIPAFLHRNKQLGSYGMAVEMGTFLIDGQEVQFGEQPERLVWYHLNNLVPYKRKTKGKEAGELKGSPVYETRRTPADYDLLHREILSIISQARLGIFYRAESNFNCSMCRVSGACQSGQIYRPVHESQLVDLEAFGV